MIVEHFGGRAEVEGADELDRVLGARFGDAANEFWISAVGGWPCLAILVRDDRACVHYYPSEGYPGFQSCGDLSGSDMEEFFTNMPTETILVPGEAVVPFAGVLAAAHEFLRSQALPTAVEWFEL